MSVDEFTLEDLKVLLVDDNFGALNLVRNMLADFGVTQVITAKNGVEALNLLTAFDGDDDFVDVVLCDWNMPRMNGIQLLKQIRSVDPELPFLMITGTADMESVAEAKSFGVTGYLKKPFAADHLSKKLRTVARIIAHRQGKQLKLA